MQYRVLLCISFLSLSIPAFAQRKGAARPTKADTVTYVVSPGFRQNGDGSLLAFNNASSTAPGADVARLISMAPPEKINYKPVPLAGQKSYFGEMNDYVNNFVRQYLLVHNQTLNVVQDRSGTPFPLIDNILEKNHIPKELKYLAVIESALNHMAVSHAGAVGPWQLMEPTAKMMGLTVNRHHDDRTDWYKSTNAAAKYLSILYSQLNDWLLVIAAYNCGPTPVQRAIDQTGSHSFWDIKQYLPRETQGHVLAFIATASIFEKLNKFIGLGSIPMDFKFGNDDTKGASAPAKGHVATPVFTEEEKKNMSIVRINDPINFDIMASEIGVDKKLMARWNEDYDLFVYKTYPTPYYNLRIPKDKVDAFFEKKDVMTKRSKKFYNESETR